MFREGGVRDEVEVTAAFTRPVQRRLSRPTYLLECQAGLRLCSESETNSEEESASVCWMTYHHCTNPRKRTEERQWKYKNGWNVFWIDMLMVSHMDGECVWGQLNISRHSSLYSLTCGKGHRTPSGRHLIHRACERAPDFPLLGLQKPTAGSRYGWPITQWCVYFHPFQLSIDRSRDVIPNIVHRDKYLDLNMGGRKETWKVDWRVISSVNIMWNHERNLVISETYHQKLDERVAESSHWRWNVVSFWLPSRPYFLEGQCHVTRLTREIAGEVCCPNKNFQLELLDQTWSIFLTLSHTYHEPNIASLPSSL